MDLKGLIYGMALFGLIFGVFTLVIGEVSNTYNVGTNIEREKKLFDTLNETSIVALDIQKKIGEEELQTGLSFDNLGQIAYASVKFIFKLPVTMFATLTSLSDYFGIPKIFFTFFVTIIIAGIGFAILSGVFKWNW